MAKNIRRIAIVIVAVLLVVFILRWIIIIQSTHKKAMQPQVVSITATLGSGAHFKDAKDLLREGKRAQALRILEGVVSSNPGAEQAYQSLLLLADIYKADGNLLKAREIYLTIAEEYTDYCDYADIQKRLTALNMDILYSPIPTADSEIYIVKSGDSLSKIARSYSTTVALIKKASGLKSDIIRPGMKLKVQKVPLSIVVDKSQSILTLVSGDKVLKTYTVSTGKNNSTPAGVFKITDKLIDPVWYSTKAIVPPGSPENVLGSRWIGIATPQPGYGIHGTTEPESIGYQCTEGCVRMYNPDVEELFDIVPSGTEISIID